MVEPEKLKPGLVVKFRKRNLIFVGKLHYYPSGLVGYLFHNGYVFRDSELYQLTNAGHCRHFSVSDLAMMVLDNHKQLVKDVTYLRPGMVILTIDERIGLCSVRKVAVVDSDHGMAYDKNGKIVNFSSCIVVNTKCEVPVEGLLTEEGLKSMEQMYSE